MGHNICSVKGSGISISAITVVWKEIHHFRGHTERKTGHFTTHLAPQSPIISHLRDLCTAGTQTVTCLLRDSHHTPNQSRGLGKQWVSKGNHQSKPSARCRGPHRRKEGHTHAHTRTYTYTRARTGICPRFHGHSLRCLSRACYMVNRESLRSKVCVATTAFISKQHPDI